MRCSIPLVAVIAITAATAIGAGRRQPSPATAGDPPEPPAILVSRQLAEAERLSVGDVVQVASGASGARARAFRVAGVYEPTPDPAGLGVARLEARLHLPDLVALTADPADPLAGESVGAINIDLVDPLHAAPVARELAAKVPGLVVRPAIGAAGDAGAFEVLERFHLAIALVTMIASSVFLLALMVMLVDERRELVGILRLIGLRRCRILLQVLAEGLLIALAGAVFGVAFAALSQGLINRFFQWRYDTALVFVRITPTVVWRSVALAVPLGLAASAASSWTLLRREGVALIRR